MPKFASKFSTDV